MSERTQVTAGANRWVQLWLGVLCMVLIANLQYAWTLFVDPMHQPHGTTPSLPPAWNFAPAASFG